MATVRSCSGYCFEIDISSRLDWTVHGVNATSAFAQWRFWFLSLHYYLQCPVSRATLRSSAGRIPHSPALLESRYVIDSSDPSLMPASQVHEEMLNRKTDRSSKFGVPKKDRSIRANFRLGCGQVNTMVGRKAGNSIWKSSGTWGVFVWEGTIQHWFVC